MTEYRLLMEADGGCVFGLIVRATHINSAASLAKHISQGCKIRNIKEAKNVRTSWVWDGFEAERPSEY